jgi:hypothetical protein
VALLGRYLVLPDRTPDAIAAWVLHTWAIEAFDTTPRLAIFSPTKGSGKTRLLEILSLVCREPLFALNATTAGLYRDKKMRTLLLDEADAIFGHMTAQHHEDLRSYINGGHRKGVSIVRASPPKMESVEFQTFGPVAMAAIGQLPDTITDRSVNIEMQKRLPNQVVQSFRIREAEAEVSNLLEDLRAWANGDVVDWLATYRPVMPDGIEDRPADVWEALIAIGDLAGEPWRGRIRASAIMLTSRRADLEQSLGTILLANIREVFMRFNPLGVPEDAKLTSDILAENLNKEEEWTWGEDQNNLMKPAKLARMLKPFGVKPYQWNKAQGRGRGYDWSAFQDAFARHLPAQEATTQPVE